MVFQENIAHRGDTRASIYRSYGYKERMSIFQEKGNRVFRVMSGPYHLRFQGPLKFQSPQA